MVAISFCKLLLWEPESKQTEHLNEDNSRVYKGTHYKDIVRGPKQSQETVTKAQAANVPGPIESGEGQPTRSKDPRRVSHIFFGTPTSCQGARKVQGDLKENFWRPSILQPRQTLTDQMLTEINWKPETASKFNSIWSREQSGKGWRRALREQTEKMRRASSVKSCFQRGRWRGHVTRSLASHSKSPEGTAPSFTIYCWFSKRTGHIMIIPGCSKTPCFNKCV